MSQKIIASTILYLLYSSCPAYALDMEFYTYGGFDIVVDAWQGIALVFGDNTYKALFFSVITIGIFLAGATSYFKLLMGARGSALAWVWPVALGVLMYLGLVVPKGTITVYDPVSNKFRQVGNIPDGLVAIAGILNKIEHGITDILYTSGSVEDYQLSAGGIGYATLLGATSHQVVAADEYLMMSLDKYNEKCVMFELARPGSSISYEDLKNQTTDFMPLWATAANPAIFTIYYDDTNRAGVTSTCRQAWDNISIALTDPNSIEKATRTVCGSVGFNPDDALQLQRCKSLLGDYANYVHAGVVPNYSKFMRQTAMAQSLEYTLLRLSPDLATAALVSKNSITSGIGMGIAANEWMPVTRAVFTAIFLGMIPILALLIPTGFAGRAIGYMVGFFIWLALWGISDVVVHVASTKLAYKVMEGVRQNNLGYTAIMLWPTFAQKALAQFGMMRSIGMFLAAAIAMAIFKFGGYAFVAMASNAVQNIQSIGAQTAQITGSPNGSAAAIEGWRGSIPTIANAYKNDFERSVAANSAVETGKQAGRIRAMSYMGGPEAYESAISHREGIEQITGLTQANQLRFEDASQIGKGAGISLRQQWRKNPAREMVNLGIAQDLNEAHDILATTKTREELIRIQSVAGQWEAAGGNPEEFYQIAAQKAGIELGSLEQTQSAMAHFGMDAKEWGAFEKTHILSEDMAAQLRSDGFSFAQAGMTANIGFDRSGAPVFMTGRMETGSYGAVYEGGVLNKSSSQSGFVMHQTIGRDGSVLFTEGSRGSVFRTQDISNVDTQRLTTNLSGFRGEYGSRHVVYDVDEKQISHGTVYNTATMFTAATTNRGSDGIAERILSMEGDMREREITAAAAHWASSVSSVAGRRGVVTDTSSASLSAGFGSRHGIGGGGSIGIESSDHREQNLMASQFSSAVHGAIDEARARGFNAAQTRGHVGGAIQALSAKIQTDMNTATTKDYGGTAPVKAAGNLLESIPISTDFEPPIN